MARKTSTTGRKVPTKTLAKQTKPKRFQSAKKTVSAKAANLDVPRHALTGQPSGTSKHDRVLELLKSPKGTTLAALMKATGWQAHSVRGFLAGAVKKKLGLRLMSEKIDGQRIYRVGGVAP
ncbi:MAG: DUF3489 domain-containing protein [Xanthobacteraceae bacterium]|nr:MAG: DUF3489 domain-containing protein [Xanthobacteraceae bacterium]